MGNSWSEGFELFSSFSKDILLNPLDFLVNGVVLCAFLELGMAGERGFAHLFGSGVVPGWFLDAKCGKVQYCLISATPCVHL